MLVLSLSLSLSLSLVGLCVYYSQKKFTDHSSCMLVFVRALSLSLSLSLSPPPPPLFSLSLSVCLSVSLSLFSWFMCLLFAERHGPQLLYVGVCTCSLSLSVSVCLSVCLSLSLVGLCVYYSQKKIHRPRPEFMKGLQDIGTTKPTLPIAIGCGIHESRSAGTTAIGPGIFKSRPSYLLRMRTQRNVHFFYPVMERF